MKIEFMRSTILSLILVGGALLACSLGRPVRTEPGPPPATPALAQFSTAAPTATASRLPELPPSPTVAPAETPWLAETPTLPPPSATLPPTATIEPLPSAETQPVAEVAEPVAPTPPTEPPLPEPTLAPEVDFVVRLVKMRSNAENSWDGTLNGVCGSDHSIYVHVADVQESLLDGVLVGDRYGNFEVPTGVDGPGTVRILVWSATMELAVMGHQDGTRYTSEFTVPLSTLDEDIPLDWLQQGGYCESPEDCQQRVETNQLCRGHYSYDVVFQRTW